MVSFELLELKPKQQRCKYWLFFNQCSSGKFSKIFLAPDNKTANEINRAPVILKPPGICCKFSRENRKKIRKWEKNQHCIAACPSTICMIYKKNNFHRNRAHVTLKAPTQIIPCLSYCPAGIMVISMRSTRVKQFL